MCVFISPHSGHALWLARAFLPQAGAGLEVAAVVTLPLVKMYDNFFENGRCNFFRTNFTNMATSGCLGTNMETATPTVNGSETRAILHGNKIHGFGPIEIKSN